MATLEEQEQNVSSSRKIDVMGTAVTKTVQESIQAAFLSSSLISRRGVSTNSAIAKGIWRSKAGATREPFGSKGDGQYGTSRQAPRDRDSTRDRKEKYPPARAKFDTVRTEKYGYLKERSDSRGFGREQRERPVPSRDRLGDGRYGRDRDGTRRNNDRGSQEEQMSRFGDEKYNRDRFETTRRKNDQGSQEEQLSRFGDGRRQERYQQGQSTNGFPAGRSSANYASERSGDRYSDRPRDSYRPRTSQGPPSQNVWQSSYGSVTSSNSHDEASLPQNRAERRAAQFGGSSVMVGSKEPYQDQKSAETRRPAFSRASDPERFEKREKVRAAKRLNQESGFASDDFQPSEFAPRDSFEERGETERKAPQTTRYSRGEELNNELEKVLSPEIEFGKARKRDIPLSLPYTTPASEFLHGTSVVIAALKSPRRRLYKLYIYDGDHRESGNMDSTVRKLALAREVEVFLVKSDWLPLMDKMSAGRPHNGYILEASPLPKLPAMGLLPVDGHNGPLEVSLDHQSREDELVNGTNPVIKYKTAFPRYPFVLMLDGILDPGNLGAILRTAYFLSVDALALSSRHSAPLTPTALKASAGASESLPLISIPTPGAFVDASKAAGWKFYAAVAPPSNSDSSGNPRGGGGSKRPDNKGSKSKANDDGRLTSKMPPPPHFTLAALAGDSPVLKHPTVLMLGSEGEGLRWNLQKKADATVGIEGGWRLQGEPGSDVDPGRVDSLNVSVAAGLLVEGFLRRPSGEVGRAEGLDGEAQADEGMGEEIVGEAEEEEEEEEVKEEEEKELF